MTSGPRGRVLGLALLVAALPGCAPTGGNLVCSAGPGRTLAPEELDESSGATWSRSDPALLWTVNDGPDGTLFLVDTAGAEVRRFETEGGRRLRDVEALASGACGDDWCVYLGDTGDNGERRKTVALLRVREPGPDEEAGPLEREAFRIRYPDGPRDVEAMFIHPELGIHLVSKGRSGPPTVYRYPGVPTADSVVTMIRIQTLGSGARSRRDMVTGATWVPGTDRVLIRTYSELEAFRLVDGRLEPIPEGVLSLGPLQEPQGEAVAAHRDGRVVTTTEGGPFRARSALHLLRCEIGDEAVEASGSRNDPGQGPGVLSASGS